MLEVFISYEKKNCIQPLSVFYLKGFIKAIKLKTNCSSKQSKICSVSIFNNSLI